MSELPGPNEAELIVLRYGEWMRTDTGPGPRTASEVLAALAKAQHRHGQSLDELAKWRDLARWTAARGRR